MAAGRTYTPIATTTLTGASDTITFSSIPQGYTDLVLVSNIIPTSNPYLFYRINSDSGANYSRTQLQGTGSSAASSRFTGETYAYIATSTVSGVSTAITHFQNYSNITTYKSLLSRWSDAGGNVSAIVNLWRSTAAINTILISTTGYSTFQPGSSFTLYGILAA